MKIYDEQISNVLALLEGKNGKKPDTSGTNWQDAGKRNLVLRGEMAYELGGGTLPAIGFLGATSSRELVPADDVILYGPDLPEIHADSPYARITLLRVDEGLTGEGEAVYDAMRLFNYTRYRVNPEGFMNRISTSSNHEPVRVSRKALEKGLNFGKVAKLYLDAYKAHPQVIAAQVIFVTLPDFDYKELIRLTQKTNDITAALDHILRDVKMDCPSCNLQVICNEVEGMRELHLKQSNIK